MPKESPSSSVDSQPGPYAIVETCGQQFWLQADRYYDLDRLKAKVDEKVTLDNVLLINDGKKITLGKPYIKGATIKLKVLAHRRGPKIIVYKMRPKKKTRTKNGHRQELTRVLVESISIEGKSSSAKVETSKASSTKTSSTKAASAK